MARSPYEEPIPFVSVPDAPRARHYEMPRDEHGNVPTSAELERVFHGPTLEQWVEAGYDPERYPGEDAFMRVVPTPPPLPPAEEHIVEDETLLPEERAEHHDESAVEMEAEEPPTEHHEDS